MDWMLLGIVLFCIPGNLLAQQGYNYPAPKRPFSGTPGQQQPTGSQAERPTGTQFSPGPTDDYQRPGQQGLSSTNKPVPGAQQNGYPSSITSGPNKPQGPQLPIPNGYQNGGRPSRPSGLYGTPSISQPSPGYPESQPQGGYPGSGSQGRPEGPQGYPGPSTGPASPQSEYPGPSITRPEQPQGGYSEQPGIPQGSSVPSVVPGFPRQPMGYPGSSARPGASQGGYPGPTQGAYPGQPQGPQVYPGPSPQTGYPGQKETPQGFPGSGSQGRPAGPQGYPGPSTGPASPQNGYPGPLTRPEKPQGGYSGQPGIPQVSSVVPGFPRQPIGYPGSSARPGASQGGYPGSPAGSTQGAYQGPSVRPGPQGGYPALAGQPETSQGFPGAIPGPSGFLTTGQPGGFSQQGSSGQGINEGQYAEGDYSAIPGEPERDYPIHSYVPETSFSCNQQQYPGYYADVETRCQVFHICANNKTYDFLCPNGTVFHQEYLVCVWWNQFDCNSAPSLYGINANIYDYSIFGSQQAEVQPGFGAQGQGGGLQGASGFPTGPGGNMAGQGPFGYPQGGPTGTGGSMTAQGSSVGYPSGSRPQGFGFPGQKPTPTELQRPGYPSTPSNGEHRPGLFPSRPLGTGIPSQQTDGYVGGRPQGATFPGGESLQRPGGYPSQGGRPQGPTGPSDQGGYPNERPGYATTIRPSSEGYPNDRPVAPVPGTSSGPQQPTREYLPPF